MEYKWIAQDADGYIKGFKVKRQPFLLHGDWWCGDADKWDRVEFGKMSEPLLINLETHDYKIEDGVLMEVPKPTRCKYADIFIEAANDSSKVLQIKINHRWCDVSVHGYEYRIKPEKKTKVRFYNYIDQDGNIKVSVDTPPPSALWMSEEQNVEI